MARSSFPYVSPSLLRRLNELWPERTPEPAWDLRQIDRYIGAREVIRKLEAEAREQSKNSLEDETDVQLQ